jgi:hypothetical protein
MRSAFLRKCDTFEARTRRRQRRRVRQREGAVMLVVMLVLLTATTMGVIALQSTQHELRAAGYNRLALQTHYVAEAALVTTLAWVDATSATGAFLNTHLDAWRDANVAPEMRLFGEPEVNTNNLAWANRTMWEQQRLLLPDGVGRPPLTLPGFTNVALGTDVVGTLGPRSASRPGVEPLAAQPPTDDIDYVVDLYDCQQLPVTASPGSQVNQGGSSVLQQAQFYCVVTARGRTYVDTGGITKEWDLDATRAYQASRFMTAHDARGTIITPPIIIP